MKIAVFHELSFGGARRVVFEFAKCLSVDNTLDLYYIDEKEAHESLACFKEVFFYKFKPVDWVGGNWKKKIHKDTFEIIKLYFLHKKIANEINRKKYDLIFVHPSKFTQAPFFLRFVGRKTIYYCQEPLRMLYDDFVSPIDNKVSFHKRIYEKFNRASRKYIDRSNFNFASVVLTNSIFSQRNIEKAYGSKSRVCYLGVDDQQFIPTNSTKKYDLLFLGRKNKIDGYDLLKSAINLLPKNIKVKIIEENSNMPLSDEQLMQEYNKSKIVLALSHNEPFGLIPLEAMACGIPVVAIKEGGYLESIIHGKTGYLVKRDPKAIVATALKLLTSDILREEMGSQARQHIKKNWTWKKTCDRFLRIMNQ